MQLKVIYGVWGCGDVLYEGGVHPVEVTSENAPLIAAAAVAGAVEVIEASKAERELLSGHVQSQEDAEAAYVAAQKAGTWHEGNLINFISDSNDKIAALAALVDADRAKLESAVDDERASLEESVAAKSGVIAALTGAIADAEARLEVLPLVQAHQAGDTSAANVLAEQGWSIETVESGHFNLVRAPVVESAVES